MHNAARVYRHKRRIAALCCSRLMQNATSPQLFGPTCGRASARALSWTRPWYEFFSFCGDARNRRQLPKRDRTMSVEEQRKPAPVTMCALHISAPPGTPQRRASRAHLLHSASAARRSMHCKLEFGADKKLCSTMSFPPKRLANTQADIHAVVARVVQQAASERDSHRLEAATMRAEIEHGHVCAAELSRRHEEEIQELRAHQQALVADINHHTINAEECKRAEGVW